MSEPRMREPPPPELSPFQTVVELIGQDLADQLSKDFGGRRLHIPIAPGEHHPLSVCIGPEAARRVAQRFGTDKLDVPLARGRRLRVVEMLRAGSKPEAVRRAVGCTRRHVLKVQADLRAGRLDPEPSPQLRLL